MSWLVNDIGFQKVCQLSLLYWDRRRGGGVERKRITRVGVGSKVNTKLFTVCEKALQELLVFFCVDVSGCVKILYGLLTRLRAWHMEDANIRDLGSKRLYRERQK